MEPIIVIFWLFLGFCVLIQLCRFCAWCGDRNFRAYVREWCLEKVNDDELAITGEGVEAMVNYICKKMKDRSDRWDCELYISPSVYRRIANEYRRKER